MPKEHSSSKSHLRSIIMSMSIGNLVGEIH